ncbi:hypothetical protein RIF29_32094 [Crotalaria pallida]|uniref:Uncharacterized protein n=1 Tax=Crotalaria pallida TaxID=3830 RepID=A0AAN9EHV3_CROPI
MNTHSLEATLTNTFKQELKVIKPGVDTAIAVKADEMQGAGFEAFTHPLVSPLRWSSDAHLRGPRTFGRFSAAPFLIYDISEGLVPSGIIRYENRSYPSGHSQIPTCAHAPSSFPEGP